MNTIPTLNKSASKVLDALTAGLAVGEGRKIGEEGGVYMQVSVGRLTGATFSVAHYYEQGGDLIPDPDMEFVKTAAGWLPVTCTLALGYFTRAMNLDENEQVESYSPRATRELVSFANMWMRNIKDQQDLKALKTKEAA